MIPQVDRLSQQHRPKGHHVGRQRWAHLLFVHWPVPIAELRALVPARLELDLLDGEAYVGIVPFAMRAIRTRFMPTAMGLNFLETNLRCYVHYKGEPGVYFFSLEASSRLAVRVARRQFGLPYHDATMSMEIQGTRIDYKTTRRDSKGPEPTFRAAWEIGDALGASKPGTVEHFLLERYLLFVERRGKLLRGQVHHRPYEAREVELVQLSDELFAAAGLTQNSELPTYAHYCAGVDVEVFRPTILL